MKVEFEQSFLKDIQKINDKSFKKKIEKVIEIFEIQRSIDKISGIKKLSGHHSAYRIRIGDYRIGFFYKNRVICFSRILHRKEIYQYFPTK